MNLLEELLLRTRHLADTDVHPLRHGVVPAKCLVSVGCFRFTITGWGSDNPE